MAKEKINAGTMAKSYDELMKGIKDDGSALYILKREFIIRQLLIKNKENAKFCNWMLKRAKENEVNVTQMPEGLYLGFPEKSQCFLNSLHVVFNNEDKNVYYCEGYYLTGNVPGLPIHHAWNRVNKKYFDVTYNLLKPTKLFRDLPDPKYISVIELNFRQIKLLINASRHRYGPLIPQVYEHKKIIYGRSRPASRKLPRTDHR